MSGIHRCPEIQKPKPDPLRAALVAIQELHRPVSVYTTEAGCCEHSDDCEGIELEQGLFCPDHKDGVTCEECAEIVQKYGTWNDPPTWPCDTRKLADDALGGDQVLEQHGQEHQDGPGHIDTGRLRRVLAEGQQLDPTTVRKLIDTVDSYQHTAFRESFNTLLKSHETSQDPLALADQKIHRVRELSRYLKKLAPGDQHYAKLIDQALDGEGETR